METSSLEALREHGSRIDREEIRRRAAHAMTRKLPSFHPIKNTAKEWVVVGGGPSINKCVDQIRKLKAKGAAVVSVNKSHDWLLEHGIVPWAHVMLDPKEWVADYVKRPRMDVRYLIASQCHDSVFENLKNYPVFLWHAGQNFDEGDEPATVLRDLWPTTPWYCLPGGTTVGLRVPIIGNFLGAEKFHLMGFDSSRGSGDKMHGYDKPEPPDAVTGMIAIRVRTYKYYFATNSHMARQQLDFDDLIAAIPDQKAKGALNKNFSLVVYGSGLLPTFAAGAGLHADPKCNRDPGFVGGYADCEALFEPIKILGMALSDRLPAGSMSLPPIPALQSVGEA